MYAARLITIILLILAILIAYTPQARDLITETWEALRPAIVEFMDGFYAAIRSVIAGDGSNDRMEETPSDPGINFERIVTMSQSLSS